MTGAGRQVRLLSLVPFPPRLDAPHGGGRATANLLIQLAQRHPVALLHLRRPGEPEADPALREHCALIRELVPPVDPLGVLWRRWRKGLLLVAGTPIWVMDVGGGAVKAAVAAVARTWQPDLVQVEYGVTVEAASLVPHETPLVLVQHEPGVARAEEDLLSERPDGSRMIRRLDYLAWGHFERLVLARAAATVVFTERDRGSLARLAPRADIRVIPLGVTPRAEPLDPTGSTKSVVFVGSFIHPPNVDAALYFLRGIMPLVRRRHPDATAYVVGDRPPAEVRAEAGPGVVVTGFVPTVDPYLDEAAVVVAPLRTGGGMRVKVIETLCAGKALVATPLAVTGLTVADGEHVLLAEGDEEFGDALTRLLDDPAERARLARNARQWSLAQPGWDHIADKYERLYESVLARDRRR